jgi:hypothetical protein
MELRIDTTGTQFMVTREGAPKLDRETQTQRADRVTGALLWVVQVMALDATGGEILAVTVDVEPKVSVGQYVSLSGLRAIPWTQGERSGVAFRASGLAVTKAPAAPAQSSASAA